MKRSTIKFINNNYSNNFRSVVLQLHLKNSKLIYLTFSLSRLKTIFNISHTKRKAACSFLIPIILLLQVSQQFYKQKKVQAMLQEHLQLFVWMNHLKIAIIMRVNPRRKRMETMQISMSMKNIMISAHFLHPLFFHNSLQLSKGKNSMEQLLTYQKRTGMKGLIPNRKHIRNCVQIRTRCLKKTKSGKNTGPYLRD